MSSIKRKLGKRKDPNAPKRKRFKRQVDYHSSSSEDESETDPIKLLEKRNPITGDEDEEEEEVTEEPEKQGKPQAPTKPGRERKNRSSIKAVVPATGLNDESSEEDNSSDASSAGSGDSEDDVAPGKRKKRNDPTVFATSISKILNSKLTTSKRADPVLARSKEAADAVKEMSEAKLEAKARQKMRDDKREKLDNGRIKDVLGLNSTDVSTEGIIEQEKKYKKLAQRGVVRMFNAIRAAQVMGEQAARDAASQGVVGIDKREQKVNEMSKRGFLELIAGGGKK